MRTYYFLNALPFFIGLAVSIAWAADEISPNDFAYGFKLEFFSGKSLYEAPLPKKIYESVTRGDLGDLRVFNSNSEVVPHEITIQQRESREADVMPPKKLKIFPLYANKGKSFEMNGVTIKTNKLGTVVEVGTQSNNKNLRKKILTGYLVDASAIETPIKELFVEFDNPTNDQFFKKVNINGSDDLIIWTSVDSNSVLANLVHQEETLVKNVIGLPRNDYKYYRLSWPEPYEPVKVSKLTARFGKKSEFESQKLDWLTVDGTVDPEDDSVFLYKLSGYFPISSVQVELTQPNSLGNVTLESRNSDNDPWERRQSKTVFSIVKEDTKLEENDISFSPRRFKFWRLKFNSQREAFGSQPPKLKFGWTPEKLRFLARGDSPFFVGFGSARIGLLATVNLQDKMFSESVGAAAISDTKVLGGDSKLTYVPQNVHPWKSWILWAVLVFGVFGLGKMVLSLLKTMKDE